VNDFDQPVAHYSVPLDSYANVIGLPDEKPQTPDNPPWSAGAGIGVWVASVLFLVIVQMLVVAPYLICAALQGTQLAPQSLGNNPTVLALSLAGTLPAHLVTFGLAWLVVTGRNKRSFGETLGWRVEGWQEVVLCVLLALSLYGLALPIIYFLGSGKETTLELLLKSSPAARYIGAFLAAVTAPVVEEVVYRGVVYGGLRKAANAPLAIAVTSILFCLVHVAQYQDNPAVVLVIFILSLTLTLVRAYTGRLLPCIIIHTVFNGVQVIPLILGLDLEPAKDAAQPQPAAFIEFVTQLLN
jgi:hypothetical protein